MMLSIFSGAYLPSMCLRRNVCLGLCSFLIGFFLLSFMSCLYILDIESLSVDHLQLFSPIHRLSFFFLMVSFAVQKLVSLIRSWWLIFIFITVALRDGPKKTFALLMLENVCLCSLLGVWWCLVLCLSLYAIWVYFLCMVWECVLVSLISMQLSSFPSTTYWRDCLFPILYSCLLCGRLIAYTCLWFSSLLFPLCSFLGFLRWMARSLNYIHM